MGSVKRLVKKIARPKVLLPLAAIALGGPALAGAMKGTAAGGALFGKAATGGAAAAAPGSLMGSGMAAQALTSAGLPATAATSGILGTAGAFAPLKGTLAKGIMVGLKNPLTKKGLMTYGGLGSLGALAMRGKPKTEAQKNLGVDAQAQYDLTREMNRMMGGAYTDEQLNTIVGPMLSQYGGEYETITNPFQRRRRPMFPGLNYSGLTRYAADGGSIKPKKRKEAIEEMENEIEQREIILDALFGGTTPGMNEEAIADQMFDMMRRKELNPTGRAMGGRIGLANGGDLKSAVENFVRDFPEFEDLESKELYKEMEKRGYLSDRDEMKDGGIMQMASAPDPMAERMDMMENLALDKFGKPLDRLSNDEIIQIEEMIDDMMPMAMGGSVPQTERIPNGMQIDGRGGGFIPMGARERKDDVPAMLAKNEFVMTADAVRAAGGGDVNKGAQRMYDLMNSLESKV